MIQALQALFKGFTTSRQPNLDPKKIYRFDKSRKAFHIDVRIGVYRDIYNDFDFSPLQNRDLDKDLIEYLAECSYEIPLKNQVIVNFYMPQGIRDRSREQNSVKGFHHYFLYTQRKLHTERRELLRNLTLYGFSGFLFLVFAYLTQEHLSTSGLLSILPEGLYIGGWVLLWEIFEVIFFTLRQINRKIRIYKRLSESEILYHYTAE
ncbi:hypothetical protein [Spirochaeta lutea]|uniref:Uncharacterized protein n=1 Tax=Spirochaeta lutea TaxID=1480694 RepID=A0A098R3T8_9SPIO|nr:hypothetical protein [Spirochaeta lutea]KGE73372.1 hypothetical protein DC28_04465 [Spirochaeta lutea]